jgi:hypothetical protein
LFLDVADHGAELEVLAGVGWLGYFEAHGHVTCVENH